MYFCQNSVENAAVENAAVEDGRGDDCAHAIISRRSPSIKIFPTSSGLRPFV